MFDTRDQILNQLRAGEDGRAEFKEVRFGDRGVLAPNTQELAAQGISYLDAIHDDVTTVSKDLLTMQSSADNAVVYKLLEEMGVKKTSPREILHSHIIPTLMGDDWLVRLNSTK